MPAAIDMRPMAAVTTAGNRLLASPVFGRTGFGAVGVSVVPGTTVICALGQRSRTDVVEALRDSAPFVRVIGDAARVSTITNAVYWGYHAALDI